jgi:hypothetical protein
MDEELAQKTMESLVRFSNEARFISQDQVLPNSYNTMAVDGMQDAFKNANDFKIKQRLPSRRVAITVLNFSPDGQLLGVADDNGRLIVC